MDQGSDIVDQDQGSISMLGFAPQVLTVESIILWWQNATHVIQTQKQCLFFRNLLGWVCRRSQLKLSIGAEVNKLAKARKMRKPPGTLGLKKFGAR